MRANLETLRASFLGHSDTEALPADVEAGGVAQTLTRYNDMFALALRDCAWRELHFARDQLGERPLQYGWHCGALLFASEGKSLDT